MMLIEETAVPDSSLPVTEFRAHLRLGSGFADDAVQDPVLKGFLKAAMSAIEGRTGKVLLARDYLWSVASWADPDCQNLPVAPVSALNRITLVDRHGVETDQDLSRVRLRPDLHEPQIRAAGAALPVIPQGGSADIRFTAGWGTAWSDLPADLAQAVLLLAAHYYEFRSETTLSAGCMPFGVTSLIERYRLRRISLGGSA